MAGEGQGSAGGEPSAAKQTAPFRKTSTKKDGREGREPLLRLRRGGQTETRVLQRQTVGKSEITVILDFPDFVAAFCVLLSRSAAICSSNPSHRHLL